MNSLVKIFLGLILLIAPLVLYAYEFLYHTNFTIMGIELNLLGSLWIVIQGIVPPILMLVGLFIIWLELDEWRIERELKPEEKKEEKPKEKKEKKK